MHLLALLFLGGSAMADMQSTIKDLNPTLSVEEATYLTHSVYRYAHAFDIEAKLLAAVIATESGFKANAVGKAGEIGLMQLHPRYHETPQDPDSNMYIGAKYLSAVRTIHIVGLGPYKWLEMYNRGPYSKKPTTFPYTNRVLRMYVKFGGLNAGQENATRTVHQCKGRKSGHRGLAGKSTLQAHS